MSTDTDGAPPSVSPPDPDDGPGSNGDAQRDRNGRHEPPQAGRRRAADDGRGRSWVQQEIDRRVAAKRSGTTEHPMGRHARPEAAETAASADFGVAAARPGPPPPPPPDPTGMLGGPSTPPGPGARRPRSSGRDRDPRPGARELTGTAHTLGAPPPPAAPVSAPPPQFAPPEGSATFGPASSAAGPSLFRPARDAPPGSRAVPAGRPPLTPPQGPPGPFSSSPGLVLPTAQPPDARGADTTGPASVVPPTTHGRPRATSPAPEARSRPAAPVTLGAPSLAPEARCRPAAPETLGAPPPARLWSPLTSHTAPPSAAPTRPASHTIDPEQDAPAVSERVRVVLSERKRAAHPVRTVEVVQEGTGVGQLLRSSLIRSQLVVALSFAAATCLGLGSLPVLFAIFPEIGRTEIFGLRLPWLLLGVLVYPFLLGLGWWHSWTAEKVEQNFADYVQD